MIILNDRNLKVGTDLGLRSGTVLLLRFYKEISWLWFMVLPVVIAYMLFNLSVWMGADPTEYYSWEAITVAIWSAPSIVGSVGYTLFFKRKSKVY